MRVRERERRKRRNREKVQSSKNRFGFVYVVILQVYDNACGFFKDKTDDDSRFIRHCLNKYQQNLHEAN